MTRRIVSLWLPRLAAERRLRRDGPAGAPFAVVAETGGALRLVSLCPEAEGAGLRAGMGLADARAIRPDLVTRPLAPEAEAAFLGALMRWAGRYSPWIAAEGADGIVLDATGCAHLFGGEAALLADMTERLEAQGLTARAACADTRGAAWALARWAAGGAAGPRGGDAVAADAPATRVRSPARRGWTRTGADGRAGATTAVIAPPGETRAALASLPVAALRIGPEAAEGLARLGLRRIGDLTGLPRGALARRFGVETVRRLDQALGVESEPVAAAAPPPTYAARLSLPEPIGRGEDVEAALTRLLEQVTARLAERGMGARRLRLSLRRSDRSDAHVEVGLARPSRDRAAIAELFARPIAEIDAGFGIDALRLAAIAVEPVAATQHRGHLAAQREAAACGGGDGTRTPECEAFAMLLSKLGGRLGFERVERYLPADSHIPARAFTIASAAYAEPAEDWPAPPGRRPILMFPPEPVRSAPVEAFGPPPRKPPESFHWRGRRHAVAAAFGPERIAPEWWLDDPAWRSGPRDYWRVECESGLRLWLFHTPRKGADAWFCEGEFA